MSITYNTKPGIGWKLNVGNLLKKVTIKHNEISHLEDRYNPKTGKKIKPEIIIDKEAYCEYELFNRKFNNDDCGELFDFCNSKLKNCQLQYTPGDDSFDEDNVYIVIKSKLSKVKEDYPLIYIEFMDIPDNLEEKFKLAEEEIKNIFGIDLGIPKIMCITDIG